MAAGGQRGLPAQCRQLETHYALTADCGQTSYSSASASSSPSSSSFLYIHLNIFLYTYFFCFVLRAYFAFSFSHASLCRSSLPYCLVLHSFIVSFFQPASRCVARFLFSFFSFFSFLEKFIHEKKSALSVRNLDNFWCVSRRLPSFPLSPHLSPPLPCYPPTQKRFVVMSELSCTVS